MSIYNGERYESHWDYLEDATKISRYPHNIYYFKKGQHIEPRVKAWVIDDIATVISNKMIGGGNGLIKNAMGGYQIIDWADSRIALNCETNIITLGSEVQAVSLTHYGKEYERIFNLGDIQSLSPFIHKKMEQYINKKRRGETNRKFGLVFNSETVSRDELENFLFYPDILEIIYTSQGEVAETVIRQFKYGDNRANPRIISEEVYKELEDEPRVLTVQDFPQIRQLLVNYPHNSFDPEWLQFGQHWGWFTKKGILIAQVGYGGEADISGNIRLKIATDTVTSPEFRKTGVSDQLRMKSFDSQTKQLRANEKEPLFIADFASEKVATEYAHRLGYRLAAPENKPGFAKWYWMGFQLKD